MSTYYNDKAKLADAIALARSFSRAKPAKHKRKPGGGFQSYDRGAPLRSAARQQLTQSIIRPGALNAAVTNGRLASVQRQAPVQRRAPQYSYSRQQNAISLATWQGQKGISSITGGRGLDFLNRKDAPASASLVQPAVTSQIEVLRNVPDPVQSQPTLAARVNAACTTLGPAPATTVLDDYLALMSQREKEVAQFDPLVDKLQHWNLQSPAVAKQNEDARQVALQADKHFAGIFDVSKIAVSLPTTPENKDKTFSAIQSIEQPLNAPQTPVQMLTPVKEICDTAVKLKEGLAASRSVIQAIEEPLRPPQMPMQTPMPVKVICDTVAKPQKGLAASRFAMQTTEQPVRTSQTPMQTSTPVKNICDADARQKGLATSRFVMQTTEQPARTPQTPAQTPTPAKCTCTPTVKPQKGLAASRFASKEIENSPSTNKFSVNLQIVIHQEFCPLFELSEQKKSQGKEGSRAQQALRAEAMPFTPNSAQKLIVDPGF